MAGERVVVIGGGITGMGVARDLGMRGIPVTVLERDRPGAGATGGSHGLLHSGARYADVDPVAARDCARERDVIARIAGGCVRGTGGLLVSLADDDDAYAEGKVAACRSCGIDAEPVDLKRVRAAVPGLAPDATRAIAIPDAVVSPARLLAATAESARRHGADLRSGAAVTDVVVDGGRVTGIRTRSGDGARSLEAAHVVNAAGAWAGRVAALAGVDVAMAPTRGTMVAVVLDGIDRVLNRCRPPADGDIVVPQGPEAVVGTTSVPVADPGETMPTRREVERVVAEAASLLPAVADAAVTRVFAGIRPLPAAGGRDASRGHRVMDHGRRDGIAGLTTVVGGKLTTYRAMAEAAADRVAADLGVDVASRTASERLPHADDPTALDRLVAAHGAGGPADAWD